MNRASLPTIKEALLRGIERLGPVRAAFIGSILLSLIAISNSITPNNDGMLYIEAAKLYRQGGLEAVRQFFNWMVFSRSFIAIQISTIDSLTGIGFEASGYLISSLFLAGACALIVACTRERAYETGWAACAVVLTMPVLNAYRDYIIREFGTWFFLFLAFWIVLKWVVKPNWPKIFAAQICICLAALFRPESLIFLPALVLWQSFEIRRPGGWRRVLMMSVIPAAGTVAFFLILLFGSQELSGKAANLIAIMNPVEKFKPFVEASARMAETVLNRWSADNAKSILLVGLLSIIPMKFASNLGLLFIPMVYAFKHGRWRSLLTLWGPFIWSFVVYALVLSLFVIERAYLAARYVAPLNLLLVPLIAGGLFRLYSFFPRWRLVILVILVTLSLSNVVSISPPKTRISDAADWLSHQELKEDRVFVEVPQVAYLAGWSFTKSRRDLANRDAVVTALENRRIDLALLDDSAKTTELEDWAATNNLVIVKKFSDRRQKTIFVLKRPEARTE